MRFGVRRRESPGIRRMPGSCAQRRRRTGAWWRGRGAGANRRHLQRNRAHGRDSPARGLSAGAVAGRAGSPSRRSGRGDAVRGARRGSTAPDRLTARRRESLGVRLGRACARTGSAARDRLAARWCGQGDRRSGAGCGEGVSVPAWSGIRVRWRRGRRCPPFSQGADAQPSHCRHWSTKLDGELRRLCAEPKTE